MSAILYKKGFAQPVKTMKLYLWPKTKHNTYEVEAARALLATWITRNMPETIGKTVSLYIDNQPIVMALAGAKTTSGQYLINSTITVANELLCKLTVRWISSHSKVRGNEAADRLAKEAAQGCVSRQADLPHLFRSPLPISASTSKQEFTIFRVPTYMLYRGTVTKGLVRASMLPTTGISTFTFITHLGFPPKHSQAC